MNRHIVLLKGIVTIIKTHVNFTIMPKSFLAFLSALLIILSACDKEENETLKQLELESVGFTGTLPDGRAFGKIGIVATNEPATSSSTNDGSYVRHGLSILDPGTGINISIELPHLKYSNDFNAGYEEDSIMEGDGATTRQIARKFYSYELVKEKLAVGDKFLVSLQKPYSTNTFRVQVNDNINYNNFICDAGDQIGSYLKVIKLIEGTETDVILGNIKTLEVIFDIDVKLYHPTEPKRTPPKKLKGFLRMKYLQK